MREAKVLGSRPESYFPEPKLNTFLSAPCCFLFLFIFDVGCCNPLASWHSGIHITAGGIQMNSQPLSVLRLLFSVLVVGPSTWASPICDRNPSFLLCGSLILLLVTSHTHHHRNPESRIQSLLIRCYTPWFSSLTLVVNPVTGHLPYMPLQESRVKCSKSPSQRPYLKHSLTKRIYSSPT